MSVLSFDSISDVRVRENRSRNLFSTLYKKIITRSTSIDQPVHSGEIKVVDGYSKVDPLCGLSQNDTVIVIYDKDNLDSLYGLSFFNHCFKTNLKAIEKNDLTNCEELVKSKAVFILGVEFNKKDLLVIENSVKNSDIEVWEKVYIFGYKQSYDYLFDDKQLQEFSRVTLFQSEDEFYTGCEGVAQLENSVAMMLKIIFYDYDVWESFDLGKYALAVAHHSCFYQNVPYYNLNKVLFLTIDCTKVVSFEREALIYDLTIKLKAALNNKTYMSKVIPKADIDAYMVYRNNIQEHINRTRRIQFWVKKDVLNYEYKLAYSIPAISYAIHDILSISNSNVDTTVCVENKLDEIVYYILSNIKGKASIIADTIKGDHIWKQANILCVAKKKTHPEQNIL